MARKKVGLVLGSGSSRGLAHIGVIKVLEKHNIPIDYIVGASFGGIIAGTYGLHGSIGDVEEFTLRMNRRKLLSYVDLANPKNSFLKGDKIKEMLKSFVGNKKITDTKIPIEIVATDFNSGKEKVFRGGKLLDAMLASSCVPGFFYPYKIGKKLYIDGGVVDPTPFTVAQARGMDVIIAVDLTTRPHKKLENPGIVDVLSRTYEIFRSSTIDLSLKNYNAHKQKEELIILRPKVDGNVAYHKASENIKKGESETSRHIRKIKNSLGIKD